MEVLMSLVKTWYTLEAAADKFGIRTDQLMEWVEEGLVRAEREGDKVVRVNIDDVRIKVETMVSRS
jgi:predicted site-specific integrase-resolvase